MTTLLGNEIHRRVDDVQVVTKKLGTATIFILGIDGTTKEEEVKEAIAREIKVEETDVVVRATRKGKYDELTIIAEVPKAQATPLINRKKIRIGWTECGIRERVDIIRCYKCLEYGHKTRKCAAQVDRSKDCIRCGETGHRGKDCVNRDKCIKCGIQGHSADQIKCPYFKKLGEGIA
ncbi:hypothetical protein QE152_g25369 [Popillia japonica]|uniref:CCHC-type domain-containing protein n=1 Tax=Popillia japonica TaxID=7064 RepID=A0AAW1K098_POPJA